MDSQINGPFWEALSIFHLALATVLGSLEECYRIICTDKEIVGVVLLTEMTNCLGRVSHQSWVTPEHKLSTVAIAKGHNTKRVARISTHFG